MNQTHYDAQSKNIFGNINDLNNLLTHPDLEHPIWPTIFSWLTKLNTEPNRQWITHPTHLNIRAQVTEISTNTKPTNPFEIHQQHYDIYLCLKGGETVSSIWVGDINDNPSYDKGTDNLFWQPSPKTKPINISLNPNDILILPPGEAHLPAQPNNDNNSITKVIAKIPKILIRT